jgi:pimeloyl-ACP methyl ester carboxylesterase
MATYVFVHGAWHGAWCWEKVVPLLEEKGHKVHAIDLPGHGNDKTPIGEVGMCEFTDKVCSVINECEEPVILVGHSLGGVVISQSAEKVPERIKSLVYVSAFLLKNNQCIDDLNHVDPEVAATSFVTDDGVAFSIKNDVVKDLFYSNTSNEDLRRVKSLLQPENFLAVSSTKLSLSERFESVPRYYIECLEDRSIPHEFQRKMLEELPCEKVFTINTDHSPFYSAPEGLVSHLLSISE